MASSLSGAAEKRAGSPSTALGTEDAKRPRLADGVTAASAGGGEWAQVISRLQPAIVALKVTTVRSFEEDPAGTALGTGFVVDHARGLILTNRHITGCGPVRATAIFERHEELEVEVIYRDPVHDFGFFRYSPEKLRLTRGAEIPLDPKGLKVGADIRVVGNDAGEKLQILSGTIARVDRNVPEFCTIYNDENTFYAGAGAGTSGGSSGSPVLNADGCAIALNAAGQEGAASAYFLPLDRVKYSLELLRAGMPVPRGTCLASFLFKPFDELIRVGLDFKHEREVRTAFPDSTGMLIVDGVFCEQKAFRPGDILLHLEGVPCDSFVQLEGVLDARVGGSVKVVVCRGGVEMDLEVPVADLHQLIPRTVVELGLDILHGLGYHAARRMHLALQSGMYLARTGFVFDHLGSGRGALICSVDNKPTPTPEAFIEAVKDIPHRQYFPVSWYELADFRRDRTMKTGFAKMSRAWSPLRLWKCEGGSGSAPERWVSTELPKPAGQPQKADAPGPGLANTGGDKLVRIMQPSLATLRFRTDRRFCTEASYSGSSEGAGILVDEELGLVLTDRHSAPQSLGDVEVTLGGAATVDGEVLFVHPLHNLAVVRCDATAMAGLRKAKVPFKAAKLAKGPRASLRPGEGLHFVGFDNQGNTFSARVTVAAVYLPSGKDEFPLWDVPRFRERNLEIVVLADTPEDARGGVLCDSGGQVRALFAAFDWQGSQREETTEAFGISTSVFGPIIEKLRREPNAPPVVPSLDIEVSAVDVATLARGAASQAGKLPQAWVQAVGRQCGRMGQVARGIRVHRILPTGPSLGRLKPGDVLLNVGGRIIASGLDLETALLEATGSSGSSKGKAGMHKRPAAAITSGAGTPAASEVVVKVLREGKEVEVSVTPAALSSEDDRRLIIWAGLVLRLTPRCILERCGESVAKVAGAVFIQNVLGGSPADGRDLAPHCFIMEVNGRPVKDLEDVLTGAKMGAPETGDTGARRWVRLRLVDMFGQEHVRALQLDPLFFPTQDLRRGPCGTWHCVHG